MNASSMYTISDLYSEEDFFPLRMLYDWLRQYVHLKEISPITIDLLKNQLDEFDLIPIPKMLINELIRKKFFPAVMDMGVSTFVPKIVDYIENSERILEINKNYSMLVDLVRKFGVSLEEGNLDEIKKTIADDYKDYSNRSKKDLLLAISEILNVINNLHIIFVSAENLRVIDNKIFAIVKGAWNANIKDNSGKEEYKSEFFELNFIFIQDKNKNWLISCIQ